MPHFYQKVSLPPDTNTSLTYYYYYIHLMAFFQDNLGKPAPEW